MKIRDNRKINNDKNLILNEGRGTWVCEERIWPYRGQQMTKLFPLSIYLSKKINDYSHFFSMMLEHWKVYCMNECVYLHTYTMTIIRVWKDNLHVIKCYTIHFTLKRNGHRKSGISLQGASKSNKIEKPTIGEPDQWAQFGTFGFPDPLDDLNCQKQLATELANFSALWVNASLHRNTF